MKAAAILVLNVVIPLLMAWLISHINVSEQIIEFTIATVVLSFMCSFFILYGIIICLNAAANISVRLSKLGVIRKFGYWVLSFIFTFATIKVMAIIINNPSGT
jgi:hypothetical protein